MAEIQVTPEMMNSIAKEIDSKIGEWNGAVDTIYKLHAEMDAMWDGTANDAFNQLFHEDHTKFQNLTTMMGEYSNAIKEAAKLYVQGEEEIRGIVTRR